MIRDQALAVSGLLNPEIGGRSVRPPQPKGVAELGYAQRREVARIDGAPISIGAGFTSIIRGPRRIRR